MKTVLFRGPSLTQSGYGCHSRQVARYLLQREDVDVKFATTPWGDTPWILDSESYCGLAGEIMKRSVKPDTKCDVSVQLQLPNEWDSSLGTKNVGITAAVETDRCHPTWINACNMMDVIIVPSQHAKTSLTNTGTVTKPLLVVPESYCDEIRTNQVLETSFQTSFNFLLFGQLTGNNPNNDRKNLFYTIKWLCEVFHDDPEVGIIIKTNAGRNSKIDRNLVLNIMKTLLAEVRKTSNPRVYLLHGDMSDNDVAGLYKHNSVKALVALSHGEGYGLPILEAAASGLPVIATNWSGYLDFMKHGKFISIHHQLSEIHPSRVDDKIFVQGARWANPSEEDFKKRISKFRSSSATPKEWATELQAKILERYSFEQICKHYDSALEGVL